MQTTLRIDDQLYRAAKAEAAREGLTLTRFLEEGIRLRLAEKTARVTPHGFRVHHPERPSGHSGEDIRIIAAKEQERHDQAKLGLSQNL